MSGGSDFPAGTGWGNGKGTCYNTADHDGTQAVSGLAPGLRWPTSLGDPRSFAASLGTQLLSKRSAQS